MAHDSKRPHMKIAALFVQTNGVYFNLPNVDPWDVERDARTYGGPSPVVAHPPCERWGRYWGGGPSVKIKRQLGDDHGCFHAALTAVRLYGGILEHPEASHAWHAHDLTPPDRFGGWTAAGDFHGYTCCVEQGHYGHPARKATWLYAAKISDLPVLQWGKAEGKKRLEEGSHSTAERRRLRSLGVKPIPRLSERERIATPIPFRDLLIDIARRAA